MRMDKKKKQGIKAKSETTEKMGEPEGSPEKFLLPLHNEKQKQYLFQDSGATPRGPLEGMTSKPSASSRQVL